MRRFLILLFVCCFAPPGCQSAETAHDYVMLGYASQSSGEHDKAIAEFNQALAIDPNNPNAYIGRGVARFSKREYEKAVADYTKAVAIDRNCVLAYECRGRALRYTGEYAKAIADSTKAAAIDPHCALAYENLGSIYATCPNPKYRDGKKAVENADKANQLSGGKEWNYLGTLAAAYAESSDFAKAQEFQEKAIELAPEKSKKQYRSRLELYKQGKPYHEPRVKK